ncbi:hydroxylamine reductase, partial [Streptococcus danieliae]|nr:hydroxylamine reductase [Streptococcus danieliae]
NFIVDALFCTITNANFDNESIMKRIDKGWEIRDALKHQASAQNIPLPEADELNWKGSHNDYDAKAATVGILREKNEDLRSL